MTAERNDCAKRARSASIGVCREMDHLTLESPLVTEPEVQAPAGSERDDETLARQAANGDREAMETLLDRHFDFVHAVCRRILRDPGLAEDARQETLFRAASRIRTYQATSSFRTWIFVIARNASLNIIKAQHRVPVPVGEFPRAVASGPAQERAVDTRLEIDAALEQLSKDRRDVIVLRYLCDLPYGEIADLLDVELNTVKTRIFRGLTDLRGVLATRSATVQ